MAKITGIGGVFLKSKGDGKALAAWYQRHLGMPLEDWGGAILRWPDDKAEDRGLTVWHLTAKDRNRTRTENSPGSWTRMGTRSSCGNPCHGTTRTRTPSLA